MSQVEHDCPWCGIPAGTKTREHQVAMPLLGKVRDIDYCIHHIVAALNAGGVTTLGCCCGHRTRHGRISLEDGRQLLVSARE